MKPISVHNYGTGLKRNLTQLDVWALSIGCVVGWGAFMMPGTTFLPVAGPVGTLIGIAIGALIMLIIGANYHYLINRQPDAGGTFAYVLDNMGYDHGFLCSWFLALVYISIAWANATALPLIFRHIMGSTFQFGFHYQIADYDVYFGEVLLSLFAILLAGIVCSIGNKTAGIIQTICALIMVGGIVLGFVMAMMNLKRGRLSFELPFSTGKSAGLGIINIVALSPWAFVGFESISHASEEFGFSHKKSMKIMALALVCSAFCYSALSILAVCVVPKRYSNWFEYVSDLENLVGIKSVPVFNAIRTLLGEGGMILLCFILLGAIITCILGNAFALSRLMLSMMRHGMLPSWFGKTHTGYIPKNIFAFFVIVSIPIPFLGRSVIGWIVDVSTIGATIAYLYVSLVTYRLARNDRNRLFSVTGFIGICCSLGFFMFFLLPNFSAVSTLSTESYLILMAWGFLGFLFFRYVYHKDDEFKFGNSTVVWTMLLFLIFTATTIWTRKITDRTMDEIVDNLINFDRAELEELGLSLDASMEAKMENYLQEQMTSIDVSMMRNSFIQVALVILTLIVLFSLYATFMKKQKNGAEELLKAKNDFLANMSHEIRTPINTIMGLDELILRETKEEKSKQYANEIFSAGRTLTSMIDDILDYSRIDAGALELYESEYDFSDMMTSLTDSARSNVEEKGLLFEVNIDETMPYYLCGDGMRIRQIFQELLANAIKYTNRGRITLNVSYEKVTEDTIILKGSVIDTGIGIREKDKKRLFDAFERINDERNVTMQGAGLGISLVKKLLNLMDGTLELESVYGLGSNFTFTVLQKVSDWTALEEKVVTNDDSEDDDDYSYIPRFKAPTARILMVDDTEMNLFVFEGLLKNTELTIDTALDGLEGLEMAKKYEYDLLLIDHRMPVMDGVQMLKALKEMKDNPNCRKPCISLTANAGMGAREEYIRLGFDDYICKPVSGRVLEKVIKKYLPKDKLEDIEN